eukprot:1331480-Amorphochlora_amoeboformis.AAC.1
MDMLSVTANSTATRLVPMLPGTTGSSEALAFRSQVMTSGHVSFVTQRDTPAKNIPLLSLAKRQETLYLDLETPEDPLSPTLEIAFSCSALGTPSSSTLTLNLDPDSPPMTLLRLARDE